MAITAREIVRRRLHNQRLSAAPFQEPAQVVDWLGAVQAQDYAGAKWALGLRLQAATDGDLDRAFNAGSILRTHLLRPTWHFVTPADIRWLLALTAPRVHAANAFMYRKLELDRPTFERSHAVLAQALQDGRQRTRQELRQALESAGIATGIASGTAGGNPGGNGLRLSYLMMAAELDGVICSGGRRGKQFTYALLEQRAAPAAALAPDEALAELSRRYFISRGPATLQDYARWSGLTIADARRGLAMVQAALVDETLDGQICWFAPSPLPDPPAAPAAHCLSIYDEYISGYKDRGAIGDAEIGARLAAMGNDLSYIILLDGRIVGTWKRTLKKDAVVMQINRMAPVTSAGEQALAAAAQRYAAFHQLPGVIELDM